VFGIGVGGEYPIASTSASERAEADINLQHRRGETVMLTFSMQGAGDASCCSATADAASLAWSTMFGVVCVSLPRQWRPLWSRWMLFGHGGHLLCLSPAIIEAAVSTNSCSSSGGQLC